MNSETNFGISSICTKFIWSCSFYSCRALAHRGPVTREDAKTLLEDEIMCGRIRFEKIVLYTSKEKVGKLANLTKEIHGKTSKKQNHFIAN